MVRFCPNSQANRNVAKNYEYSKKFLVYFLRKLSVKLYLAERFSYDSFISQFDSAMKYPENFTYLQNYF